MKNCAFKEHWKSIVLIGAAIIVATLFICCNFFLNMFIYNDLDVAIKFATGIGTILTAWGVYWKWNDEKTRKLYENRLRLVYAPLGRLVLKQEMYRWIYVNNGNDIDLADRAKTPMFSVKKSKKIHDVIKGALKKVEVETPDEVPSYESYLNLMDEKKYGLARPQLLVAIAKLKLMFYIREQGDIEIDSDKVDKNFVQSQEACINEIINGYNNCIEKLGMDDKKINIDNPPDFLK